MRVEHAAMDPPAPEVDPDEVDVDEAPPLPPAPDDASSAPASGEP